MHTHMKNSVNQNCANLSCIQKRWAFQVSTSRSIKQRAKHWSIVKFWTKLHICRKKHFFNSSEPQIKDHTAILQTMIQTMSEEKKNELRYYPLIKPIKRSSIPITWLQCLLISQDVLRSQGRRNVWKSGGASGNVVGISASLVGIGLPDLPKSGGAMAPPCSNRPGSYCCSSFGVSSSARRGIQLLFLSPFLSVPSVPHYQIFVPYSSMKLKRLFVC